MSWLWILLITGQIVMSASVYAMLRKAERQNWRDQFYFWAVIFLPWAFLLWAVGELVWDEVRRWSRRRR